MVFVTGDTHGMHDFFKLKEFADSNPQLTKNDIVIIAGDFGAVWSEATLNEDLKPYEELPFTLLFVDGNHENFELLYRFPLEEWNGGRARKIRESVIHLPRGQVFEIEGKTFFTFGGATSVDKAYRKVGIDWWAEELPTYSEISLAEESLKKVGNKVDFVITHSCDEKALYYPPIRSKNSFFEPYPENRTLSYFEDIIDYGHWYFGHYHLDGDLTDKKTVLYQEIRRLV